MTTAAKIAAQVYLANGWCPVPIAKGAKKPRLGSPEAWRALWQRPCWAPERPKSALLISEIHDGDDWQWLRLRPEDLEVAFANGASVGVNLGEPSADLTDIDCDAPEVLHHADRFLSPTRTFGRAGKPESHWLYRARGAITCQFKEPKALGGTMLVELRSTAPARAGQNIGGSQTVFPGSLHPSGETIEWTTGTASEPAEISAAELRTRVGQLAVATLLERRHPDALAAFLAAPTQIPAGVPAELQELVRDWLQLERPAARPPAPQRPANASSEGLTGVRAQGVAAVARALGLALEEREGKLPGLRPCPACGDTARGHTTPDRRPPVELTSDGGGWHCYRCDAKGDAVDLAALVIVRTPTPTQAQWLEVRERCADLGLCTPVHQRREEPPHPAGPWGTTTRPTATATDPAPSPSAALAPSAPTAPATTAAARPAICGPDTASEPPPPSSPLPGPAGDPSADESGQYMARPSGLIRWRVGEQGEAVAVQLTNFLAQVTSDITEDDGVETKRVFEVEGRLQGRVSKFTVPAKEFGALGWVIERLGARAVVFPPRSNAEHARAAIQLLSKDIATRTVYTHMGWREVDGRQCYLHAGGGIGPDGPVAGVDVALPGPSLRRYALPDPPTGTALQEAVRSSMRFLDLAPYRVTIPIFSAIWRAALWSADFSLGVVGHTGSFKSALNACAQQHYGPEMDGRHFPAAWTATENALEGLAFAAKDAMLSIDDFAPGGSQVQVQQLHAKAERILRAQGNQSGRSRMRADATLRPDKPPRGLIVWTGEDIPRGQSVRARALIVEIERDDVDVHRLTEYQALAAAGVPAQAFAGFVRWLAPRREELLARQRDDIAELREKALGGSSHRRTPEIIANLMLGLRTWSAFARELGVLEAGAGADLEDAAWEALGASAAAQAEAQRASDPINRFFGLLSSAVASGAAHLASQAGAAPADSPEGWGWRLVETGGYGNRDWRPSGSRVGWVDHGDLYLDTQAALSVVTTIGQRTEDSLAISATTLRKRLNERGLLLSTDAARQCLETRRMLEGQRRQVLHLRASSIFQDQDLDLDLDQSITQDPAVVGLVR